VCVYVFLSRVIAADTVVSDFVYADIFAVNCSCVVCHHRNCLVARLWLRLCYVLHFLGLPENCPPHFCPCDPYAVFSLEAVAYSSYCNTVEWFWWDWSLSQWPTGFLQCFYAVGWVIWPVEPSLNWLITCQVGHSPHDWDSSVVVWGDMYGVVYPWWPVLWDVSVPLPVCGDAQI